MRSRISRSCFAILAFALATRSSVWAQDVTVKQDTTVKFDNKTHAPITAPILIHSVAPRISNSARQKPLRGVVVVNLWVGTDGLPSHVHVLHGLTPDLDASALEAVSKYRFKAATENGKPVLVELNVEVNFSID